MRSFSHEEGNPLEEIEMTKKLGTLIAQAQQGGEANSQRINNEFIEENEPCGQINKEVDGWGLISSSDEKTKGILVGHRWESLQIKERGCPKLSFVIIGFMKPWFCLKKMGYKLHISQRSTKKSIEGDQQGDGL